MELNKNRGKISLTALSDKFSGDYKDGKIVTAAFNYALKNYSEITVPKGKYYIDEPLIVYSDTAITAENGAEIIVKKGVKTLLLRNASVIDGSDYKIPSAAPTDENICVRGGVWAEENDERLGYGESGRLDLSEDFKGVSTCFLFSGVKNLVLENLVFRSTAGFAVQLGRVRNLTIENIEFKNCFADGLHINGGVNGGSIKNLFGHTEDDLIALNAYDWDNSTINFGAIENLSIDGVKSDGAANSHKSVRLQAGVYPYKDGEKEDCYIKNLSIKNVVGAATFKMYLQTPAYTVRPEKTVGVGRIENVTFENIETDTTEPVDKQPNYLNGDKITGNFAAFEVGSFVKNLRFKNVKVKLNREKYPDSYFMTVGPKSQYIAEKHLELFDPYVSCTVDGVSYSGVYINGVLCGDLTPYIKQVAFDNLYPSELPFGKGEIFNINRIID